MSHLLTQQTITVYDSGREPFVTEPQEMANLAGRVFPLAERMSGGAGEAFDFGEWFVRWRAEQGIANDPLPTHLKVEAADRFEALIPWDQLEGAMVLFAQDNAPLEKGGPIRLYVPNGSSACLNVKRVVTFRFLRDEEKRGEVAFGFKQQFSSDEMRIKR